MIKIDKKNIIIAVLVVLLVGLGWYMFCSRNHDGRIERIEDNISAAREYQQGAITDIDGAKTDIAIGQAEAGRIAEGIGSTAEGINTVTISIDDSIRKVEFCREQIAESERGTKRGLEIIERVEQRNKQP